LRSSVEHLIGAQRRPSQQFDSRGVWTVASGEGEPMKDFLNIASPPARPCGCAACSGQPGALARRQFLTIGAGAGLVAAAGLAPRRAWAQSTLAPDAALERLMAGNTRFVSTTMASFKEDLALLKAHTVDKQEPFAAVLSCADSRVPVEIVFDQSIGRLFVTRVAGNVATTEIIASLEYGAAVLGTRLIMVLAHQGCGAIKAAVGGKAVPGQISALYARMRPAVEGGGHDYEATAKLNAKIQADLLATASPVLAEQIAAGSLKVVAAYYSLETGKVTIL
jgi:carbonic anhydrase